MRERERDNIKKLKQYLFVNLKQELERKGGNEIWKIPPLHKGAE